MPFGINPLIPIRKYLSVVPPRVTVQAYDFAAAELNWPQVRWSGFPSKLNSGAETGVEAGSTTLKAPFVNQKTSLANGTTATSGVSDENGLDAPATGACTNKVVQAKQV